MNYKFVPIVKSLHKLASCSVHLFSKGVQVKLVEVSVNSNRFSLHVTELSLAEQSKVGGPKPFGAFLAILVAITMA